MNCKGRGSLLVPDRSAPGLLTEMAASLGGIVSSRLFWRRGEVWEGVAMLLEYVMRGWARKKKGGDGCGVGT